MKVSFLKWCSALAGCLSLLTTPGFSANNALDFDGVDDSVSVTAGLPTFTVSNTIEFWIKPNSLSGIQSILSYDSWASGYLHLILIDSTLRFAVNGNQPSDTDLTSFKFTPGYWYHIALAYSTSSKTLDWYVNGELVQQNTFTTARAIQSAKPFRLGSWEGTQRFLNATLDEFRFWSSRRPQASIQNAMTGEIAGSAPNLQIYYPFNSGVAGGDNTGVTTLPDAATSTVQDGTLSGFALTGTTSNWVPGTDFVITLRPGVTSPTSASVTGTMATLGATVTGDGGTPITERGVVYAPTMTNPEPKVGGAGVQTVPTSGTLGTFTVDATGLTSSTDYTFAAYAVNRMGITYSPTATFTTALVNEAPGFKIRPALPTGPAGAVWSNSGLFGYVMAAYSQDGSKLLGLTTPDIPGASQLLSSTDHGEFWSGVGIDQYQVPNLLATNDTGTKVAIGQGNGFIYVSSDGGVTWDERASAQEWADIAMSGDGNVIAASVSSVAPTDPEDVLPHTSSLYVSTNGGVTWAARGPKRYWSGIACSRDGKTVIAGEVNMPGTADPYPGRLFISRNSGSTWVAVGPAFNGGFISVACSSDAKHFLASPASGGLLVSNDAGVTWTQRFDGPSFASSVAVSSSGTSMVASLTDGLVTSSDGGLTWSSPAVPPTGGYGGHVVISPNGRHMWLNTPLGVFGSTGPNPLNLKVLTSSGTYTESEFARRISPGPENEVNQNVTFTLTSDNNALFVMPPAIESDGTLTFTPGAFTGTAEVTVVAHDDGGTDFGGVDTSAPQRFTISILPNTNANLSALSLSSGTLAPDFASAISSYSTTVDNSVTSIIVTPAVEQVSATVQARVNGGSFVSVSTPLPLNLGDNLITVLVTAQDGVTTRAYTVLVNRQLSPPASSNVTAVSATLGGTVTSDTGLLITERGVVFARTAVNAIPLVGGAGVTRVMAAGTSGAFSLPASNLLPSTTYSFRTYASNNSYSPVVTFTTPAAQPKIEVFASGNVPMADNGMLPFGDAATGTTKSRTIVIRNAGPATLSGISATLAGTGLGDFSTSVLPSSSLQPGASMNLVVFFKPTAQAQVTVTLSIASNDPNLAVHRTELTGNGVAPAPAVIAVQRETPTVALTDNGSPIDFGSVVLGTERTVSFTIRNDGTLDLTGLLVSSFGSNATDFLVSPPAVSTLGAADTVSFAVTLRPGATGVRSATIRIANNDSTKQPFFRINMSGTGIAPEIDMAQDATSMTDGKSTVSFGTAVAVGSPVVRNFTITNTGTSDLTLGLVAVDGPNASEFAAGAPGNTVLAPLASTTLSVTFTPASFGTRVAVLRVVSNDGNESPFDIRLTGTAVGPEISVQQPANVQLISNVSTVAFGPVISTASTTITFWVRNLGTAPLTGIAVTSDTVQFAVLPSPVVPATLAPGGSAPFAVTFTPGAVNDYAGSLSIASNDLDEATFKVALTGRGVAAAPPSITTSPLSQIVALGQPVTFLAVVESPLAFTQQWSRITGTTAAVIKGATSGSYTIPAVKLSDAASLYRVRAANVKGTLFADSTPASLTVVDRKPSAFNLPAGSKATFTIAAASSNALTYLWKKNGGPLPVDSRFVGGDTAKLVVSSIAEADAGTYTCDVISPEGTMTGGNNVLTIFTDAPVISPSPLVMSPAIVSGKYSFFVPLDPDHGTATSFSCSTPPAGLKFDSATGELYGKPTVSKPTPFNLTVTATNSAGTASAPATLLISPLTPEAAGSYVGIIQRGPLTDGLGGRVDLSVTATGSYTGSVTLGAGRPLSFPVGSVNAAPGSAEVEGHITIPRGGLPPVTIDFVIDTATKRFVFGRCAVSAGSNISPFEGWRNVWSASRKSSDFKGYYTFALESPVDPSIPQGHGYGALTIPQLGEKFSVAGRLSDGDTYTASAILGPDGDIMIFTLLPAKGSLHGLLQVQLGNGPLFTDNALTSVTLSWSRPASAPAVDGVPIYAAGFAPVSLTAEGGRYVAPVAPALVMNKVPGLNNALVSFEGASIGGPPSVADRPVTLTTGANVSVPAAGIAQTSLKIVTGTGLFSGGFLLRDSHPFLSGAPLIERSVKYQGIIIPTAYGYQGKGFFLLQQLPATLSLPPVVPPVLSGKALLE